MILVSLHSSRNPETGVIHQSFYNRLTDWEVTMEKPAYLCGCFRFGPEVILEKVKTTAAHDPCPDGVQTLENWWWGSGEKIN